MIKHVFIFEPAIDMVLFDRWYFRFHSKECVRFFGPWLRRYETYRAYKAPAEADRFGARRGRMTELWYSSVEDFLEAKPLTRPYTMMARPSSGTAALPRPGAVTIVPAMPTEDFLGKEPTPEEVPILRWYQVLKYPEGVSVDEGERWYLEAHSPEAKEQPGLLRFVSHRSIDVPGIPNPYPWHRVTEMWYEDFDAWRKAVIDSPPRYTPPPWSSQEPFVDMTSTFLPYKPDVDFLKDNPLIP